MYSINVITCKDLVDAIEMEQMRLGHDLSNSELQDLVHNLIREGKAKVLSVSKEKPDIDLLAGNLREDGVKVLNINEEMRQKGQGEK